jgi:hypothetical protein
MELALEMIIYGNAWFHYFKFCFEFVIFANLVIFWENHQLCSKQFL